MNYVDQCEEDVVDWRKLGFERQGINLSVTEGCGVKMEREGGRGFPDREGSGRCDSGDGETSHRLGTEVKRLCCSRMNCYFLSGHVLRPGIKIPYLPALRPKIFIHSTRTLV